MADKTTLIKEAQKYLAKGQLDKAVGEWEKIVKEYPDGNNFNFIGDLYLKKNDKTNAIESFHKAANFFREEGFSLKALALFKKVLNINPADASALYALGELSEEKALVTDAIKYYLATADSLAKEGKKNELFDIYGKILSLSPSNIPLRIKVAEILFKEGLKTDAAKEYFYVAGIYEEKGDLQKAEEFYRKSINMHPLNKDAVIGLSRLYEKTDEADKAIELMKEATVLFHENSAVLLRAAELSLTGNFIENAKSYLLRINEFEPRNAKAHRLLGEIYVKEGSKEKAWEEYLIVLDDMILEQKFDDAIQLLNSFREIDPLEMHKRLVSLYKQIGEEPHVIEELTLLGDVYYDRGKTDEALACYREALELAPDNDYLQERTAELHGEEQGKVPEFTDITEPRELFEDEVPVVSELYELTEDEAPAGSEPADFIETTGRNVSGHISITAKKPVDEIFTEADIFFRYGLLNEARELLEGLRLRVPENIDLHLRLKNIYADLDDKESAVTECLILSELYKHNGDTENSEKVFGEACELYPSDPRLAEKRSADLLTTSSSPSKYFEEGSGPAAGEGTTIEDYEEELSEADFYARQGLVQEALKILLKMQGLFPENRDVAERLEALGEGSGISFPTGMPAIKEQTEASFEFSKGGEASPDGIFTGETPERREMPEEAFEQMEYEDFSISEDEVMEAQQMPEPTLDNDVLEIFQEFKKGLEGQLEDEDSETHYNLGIAYKEMGLVDDAINEFQTAQKDIKRFLQSSSMLGVCYMEKGLFSLAIDVLNKTLESIKEQNESYWSVKYDLAEAYEKNNNLRESLDLYTEVYGWNAKFRNVSEKLGLLKTQTAKTSGKEKTKERKNRVSYL
ncbi:MAG: Tetratricopeptide repeat protein [Nitrospirae bacterium]|nr:Tetratricopeptide repeat protein [Nitrospirota bacterium]